MGRQVLESESFCAAGWGLLLANCCSPCRKGVQVLNDIIKVTKSNIIAPNIISHAGWAFLISINTSATRNTLSTAIALSMAANNC